MSSQPVCAWCSRDEGSLIEVTLGTGDRLARNSVPSRFAVHPEHEGELRRFHTTVQRHGSRFLLAVLGLVGFVMPALVIFVVAGYPKVGIVGIGVANAALGILLTVLPFPTPETLRWLGAAKAVRIVRAAGVLITAIGGGVVALALFQG